ncbi:hypothetical protein ACULNC_26325 [Shigella flexneri]
MSTTSVIQFLARRHDVNARQGLAGKPAILRRRKIFTLTPTGNPI